MLSTSLKNKLELFTRISFSYKKLFNFFKSSKGKKRRQDRNSLVTGIVCILSV